MTTALVGRGALVDRSLAALTRAGSRGVTVIGPAGIGKTALVRHLADTLAPAFDTAWVSGTTASGDIPLAAFAAYLPPTETEPGLASLVAVRDALVTTTGDRRRLLVVDDAHALDETSAAVVQQLIQQRVLVLMTQRSGAAASDTVSRLWREQTLERIDVEPLDADAVRDLASTLLHGEVDVRSAHDVWLRSGGNPLFARELVLGSHAAGEWADSATGWRWTQGTAGAPRLTDLLRERLDRLDGDQRDVLDHLAFGEPMTIGEFGALGDEALLESLERLELITAEFDRRRIVIRFTHPLHAEVIRRSVSPLRARSIQARLAESLRATGTRRRNDLMRLAVFAVDGGIDVERDRLVAAARLALATADPTTAIRLAQAAFERFADFETGHVLADALYEAGGFDAIEQLWSVWTPLAATPEQHAFVAMHQAVSWYYRAGDGGAAFDVLERAVTALPAGHLRDEAIALSATLHAMSGHADRARSIAAPLLESADGRVLVQASLAMVQALRAGGRTGDAVELGRRAMATLGSMGPAESLVSATVFGTGEASVLLAAGRFDEALQSADRAFEAARRANQTSAEGLAQLSRSEALAMAGRFTEATSAARHAESAFDRSDHRGFRRWATSQRAYVAALAGDRTGCAGALADLDRIGEHPAGLFDHVAVMARATESIESDHAATSQRMLEFARSSAERGDVHAAIRVAYELVRHGDLSGVEPLVEWSTSSDSALHHLMAEHAGGLRDDDVDALSDVARRFAACGAIVFATGCAEHAASIASRRGDPRLAARLALTGDAWRHRFRVPNADDTTPELDEPTPAVSLTRREREIALLASQGLASRAIGDRLFLSPRTVENHLAKAYGKLGVGSRAALAHALATA